ncbi:MAG: PHP domain-containing protein [Gammaproteobacteria bacterium]|nr:PHP domain-containing protein [Gammaproteobacteria bacterium]
MLADLHTHTTASDGVLSPEQLITSAKAAGVTLLSITDHDTISAYKSLPAYTDKDMQLVYGIELSSIWHKTGIHVVGLNIDPDCPALQSAIETQRNARRERAKTIADKLSKLGFTDTLEGAIKAAKGTALGRPHFARFLVDSGQVKTISIAFKKFLGQGKPGDVRENWPALETVIAWISEAGGTAVLAHPNKYKLGNLKLQELTKDFCSAGGHGLEVISGKQEDALTSRLGTLAQQHGLLASCGSDFHQPGQSWAELGSVAALPSGCTPVWENW